MTSGDVTVTPGQATVTGRRGPGRTEALASLTVTGTGVTTKQLRVGITVL